MVSWNIIITALMQHRRVDEAQELFNRMPENEAQLFNRMKLSVDAI